MNQTHPLRVRPAATPVKRRLVLQTMAALALPLAQSGCGGGGDAFNRIWGSSEAGLVNGDAATARFSNPANVSVAADGTVYVADFDNGKIRVIGGDGMVTTLNSPSNFARPFGLALTADSQTLYVQTDFDDAGSSVPNPGTVWRFNLGTAGSAPTVVARGLGLVRGLVVLADGRLAMSDLGRHMLSILDPSSGNVTLLAGQAGSAGYAEGTGAAARFSRPYGLARTADGALLVADQNNHRIRRVTLAGEVSTFAGNGTGGSANGAVGSASFNRPQGVTVHGSTVFIADTDNHVVRRIADGQVSTEAGSVGVRGFADGEGAATQFYGLEGLCLTADGSVLWIADGNNGEGTPFHHVRRLKV